MRKIILLIGLGITTLCMLGLIIGIIILVYVSKSLPDFQNLSDYRPNLVTTVYAQDGKVIGELYKEKRYLIAFKDIPTRVTNAFLAAEDKAFYQHDGVNFISIIRALIINTWHGSVKQGGSTITQQVVKALLLTPERTYIRKLKEGILAYRIEKQLSKEEIFIIYLNQIYFGEGAYGVEAASRGYFGKHVQELTIAEAAILASLPKAPSRFNPYKDPEIIRDRQLYVLGQMLEMNWVTRSEYNEAVAEELIYKKFNADNQELQMASIWYLEQVRQELMHFFAPANLREKNILIDEVGEDAIYTLGLNVYTSLRSKEQIAARTALHQGLRAVGKRRGWNGPIRRLTTEKEIIDFNSATQTEFILENFIEGKWVEGLVIETTDKYATVRIGTYQGRINLADMSWARKPDVTKALYGYNRIKSTKKALTLGDIILVSYKKDKKNKVVAEVTQKTLLPLVLEQIPPMDGAIITLDVKTGGVIAMTGGYNFNTSKFNRAIQARRQPGSSFKPIVYSAALDNGYTPSSVVLDAPIGIIDASTNTLWRPNNYEKNFFGYMLLRKAIALSRNLCTIRITQDVGVTKIIERAKALGLTGEFPLELGISLGTVETTLIQLTEAFAVFANAGVYTLPRFINVIKNNIDITLYEFPVESKEVISAQNAYIMQYLMQGVINEGTGKRARVLNIPVAGKTGTSNDEKDAWFIGLTPHLATGVYIGFDQVQSLGQYEGGSKTALPVFVEYMQSIKSLYSKQDFAIPEDIVTVRIDTETGLLPGKKTRSTLFIPFIRGTEPVEVSGSIDVAGDSGTNLLKELF